MQQFATILFALIFETTPFLLAGVVISVAAGPYIERGLTKVGGNAPLASSLAGVSAGIVLPMCDCGSRPLAHRLALAGRREFAVAFLMASPVVNPVVVITTWLAFRDARFVALRIGVTVAIALVTTLVLSLLKMPIARPVRAEVEPREGENEQGSGGWARLASLPGDVLSEFFELFTFLVAGSALAAAVQVFVDQSFLTSSQGAVISILALMALAFLLSICSSVDAFVAAGLGASLGTGPLLAFLTLGPLVNIKSLPMYLRLFSVPAVLILTVLAVQVSFGASFVAEYRGW